LVTYIIVTLR